jgi:hypothetical protein
MDPKGKGMVVNDKEKESFVNDPKDDKPNDSSSSHKRKDGKKKKTRRIKEIVYYDSDESSSSQKDDDDHEKKKTVNSNFSFDYSRIPQSSMSHPVLEGKPNANHVRTRISYSRTQQLHNMDIITQCSNSIKREIIVDYIIRLRRPYSPYNQSKCEKETQINAAFTGSQLGVAANPRLELVVVLELLEVSFHSFIFS